jgi:hypothetical protein
LEFALDTNGGCTNLDCFYDRMSHGLIGAHLVSELRVYCGGDSITEDSGVVVLGPCSQPNGTRLAIDCQPSP